MPAKRDRPEDIFIRLFVSAYENFAWAGSEIQFPDKKLDGTVDGLITRADGQTIAIEHTLIEPFVGDKRDLAAFDPAFRRIKNDPSLAVPFVGITVYVPVGILDGRKPAEQELIIEAIRTWIADNRFNLHEGKHEYQCNVHEEPSITLTVKRNKCSSPQGTVLIGRQQMTNDLDKVIEKALKTKLPKLIKTSADRHILFLERDQFNFFPDLLFAEVERQRPNFPLLEKVDEIWHVETIFYKQYGSVYFELRKGDQIMATMSFENDELINHSNDGMPYPT